MDVVGTTLTLTPAPAHDHARQLVYGARYARTGNAGSEVYATLTDALAATALYKAQEIALRWIAQAVSRDAWEYAEAEQRVNKRHQAAEFRAQADAAAAQYWDALAASPTLGQRATYTATERDLARRYTTGW
jgi:hypothetical protein